MYVKQSDSDEALDSIRTLVQTGLEYVNRGNMALYVPPRRQRRINVRVDYCVLYISTFTARRDILDTVFGQYFSNVQREPHKYICIARIASPSWFSRSTRSRSAQDEAIRYLEQYCYTLVEYTNHAKYALFTIVGRNDENEPCVCILNYFGSTNFTTWGLGQGNYECYTYDNVPFCYEGATGSELVQVLDLINQSVDRWEGLKTRRDRLERELRRILEDLDEELNRANRLISGTPIIDLYLQYIKLNRSVYELITLMYNLPGKKLVTQYLEKLYEQIERLISDGVLLTSEELEFFSVLPRLDIEMQVRKCVDTLGLDEGKLKNKIGKLIEFLRKIQQIYKEYIDKLSDIVEKKLEWEDFEIKFIQEVYEKQKETLRILREVTEKLKRRR